MAAKTRNPKNFENRGKMACNAIAEIRATLYKRMVDYVLANENRLRDEILGEDSYSFTLQQLDEQFLNKLSVIDRAASELMRSDPRDGQMTTTTYETVEVIARREDLPQKVADALAEHAESDLLDVCVLKADEKQAEIMLILAREEPAGSPTAARPGSVEQQERGELGESGEERQGESGGPEKN